MNIFGWGLLIFYLAGVVALAGYVFFDEWEGRKSRITPRPFRRLFWYEIMWCIIWPIGVILYLVRQIKRAIR